MGSALSLPQLLPVKDKFYVLELRTMRVSALRVSALRISRNIAMLSATLAVCGPPATAQKTALPFHPGAWEISSVTTAATGRAVSSVTNICIKEQIDFWKVAQANLTCKPPKSSLNSAGGFHVRVHCTYDKGPLHSEIHSDVVETFSDRGNSFALVGTTTTDTVYQGVQPKHTSVHLKATAHRTGPCQ